MPLLIGHYLMIFLPLHPLNSLQYRQKNPQLKEKAFMQKYQVTFKVIAFVAKLKVIASLGSVVNSTSLPDMKTPPSIAITLRAALASATRAVLAMAPTQNCTAQAVIIGLPFTNTSMWLLNETPKPKLIPKNETGEGKGMQIEKLQLAPIS